MFTAFFLLFELSKNQKQLKTKYYYRRLKCQWKHIKLEWNVFDEMICTRIIHKYCIELVCISDYHVNILENWEFFNIFSWSFPNSFFLPKLFNAVNCSFINYLQENSHNLPFEQKIVEGFININLNTKF